jgi:diguanylate cyclase (GGDEF)-like protein
MFDITERKKTEEKLLSLQKELEVLSFKDSLTNIANRRRFDSSFELEWERARSERHPLSILLLDVDFFKQYNDLYGHSQGDECLVDIAQTLSLALDGPRDLVARYGGEEFAVLLPEADAGVARKVAERCQRLLQKKSILHALSPHGRCVTLSIGAGTVVPDEKADRAAFIKAVDQQLYVAKNNGRHRIEHVQLEP